jgi:nucleotide-binding universal stress UspA family protein
MLVVLDTDRAGDGRLALAVDIAQGQGAYLDAVFLSARRGVDSPFDRAMRWPRLPMTEPSRHAWPADLAQQWFHTRLGSHGIEGEWHVLDPADSTSLLSYARAADLIIIGQANPDRRLGSASRPEEIVLACGRPVLLVPYVGSYPRVGRRVLVAWDGSREAARALNDALPLIANAETVTLLTVRARDKDFGRDRSPTRSILRHLARHGIVARLDERPSGDNTACDVLLNRAVDLSADLIVAGAARYSRLLEALLGSVSGGLFRHMTVPVLMSHWSESSPSGHQSGE